MVPDVTAPVERFHRILVDEIRKKRPDYLSRSFQLSEIYQRLVPYRSHRDALGLEMNGDYEDVLLRLLAGAGDLVVLESPEAREQIRRELDSKNPNTGLFREFADAPVHLNAAGLAALDADIDVAAAATGPVVRTEEPVPDAAVQEEADEPETPAEATAQTDELQRPATSEPEPAETDAAPPPTHDEATYFDFETTALDTVELEPAAPTRPHEPPGALPEGSVEAPDPEGPDAAPVTGIWKPGHPTQETARDMIGQACGWCGDALPDRDEVNFCPHCGKTTALKPCQECGDEMELDWRFCVRCGTQATEGVAVAT